MNDSFWWALYVFTVVGYLWNVWRYIREVEKWRDKFYIASFELEVSKKTIERMRLQK